MHNDWWFNGGLILVGILQLVVFGFQGYWLLQTVKTARQAASAVDAVERPYFVLESLTGFQVRREQVHREYVEYSVANIGRTPALLDELWVDFHYGEAPPKPPRAYQFPRSPVLTDIPFGSGKTIKDELQIYIRGLYFLHRPTLMPNIEPDKYLYFIALAKYHDVSGRGYETGVCRVYTIHAFDTFEKYGGIEYNYQK
ncbi:MAG TPA: hypothetical protein VGM07_22760 [Stellaceae bacterium]